MDATITSRELDRPTGNHGRVGERLWARGTEHIALELPERKLEKPRESEL